MPYKFNKAVTDDTHKSIGEHYDNAVTVVNGLLATINDAHASNANSYFTALAGRWADEHPVILKNLGELDTTRQTVKTDGENKQQTIDAAKASIKA